jgi:hypothetical protein
MIMSSATTYRRQCGKCKEDTLHVPVNKGFVQVAMKIVKVIIFFVSFGMLYPHTFAEDDDIMVTCEKCGTQVTISPE